MNDPAAYLAALTAALADFPRETIVYVTDPSTGIASKPRKDPRTGRMWTGLPDAAEVRLACDDHYGPTRRAMEREAAERRQLAERAELSRPSGPRKTYEELIEGCRAAGLDMGGPKKPKETDINAFLAEHGVSREQFDAMPDAPGYRWK